MKEPKFCSECKYSEVEVDSPWNNKCYNPYVVSKSSWALGANGKNGKHYGKSCTDERRETSWFSACGMKGKQWESKD